jgi:hypothetical protein
VFALLIEIPIAMIFVSRILNRRANRWANTIAAVRATTATRFSSSWVRRACCGPPES